MKDCLVFELEKTNNTLPKFTKGSKQLNKILQSWKIVGDKKGLGYNSYKMTSTTTQFEKAAQEKFLPLRNTSYIPTFYHCGEKGTFSQNIFALEISLKFITTDETIQEIIKKVSIFTD